jgi:S-(hydroxymethyl)glutathione dehydrogenase/alcohol dehydrogenase
MNFIVHNSNPNPEIDTGGYFGFTERYGNYPDGQAEYLHVPFGNFMPFVIPESCELDSGMKRGDTVTVLRCGPVGLMTQKFAWIKGAKRVIAIDNLPYRLNHAKKENNVETFNFEDFKDMGAHIKEITKGGTDIVIDCVGMDGKKSTLEAIEQKLKLQGGTLSAFEIAINAVRKFGTIQLTGVYGSMYNMFPLGTIFERNVTLKNGTSPCYSLYARALQEDYSESLIQLQSLPIRYRSIRQAMLIKYLMTTKISALRLF